MNTIICVSCSFTLCLDSNFGGKRKKWKGKGGKGRELEGIMSCLFRREGKGKEERLEFSL